MTALPAPGRPEDVLALVGTRAPTSIVPLANGEPVAVLDAIEAAAEAGDLEGVRVHQMHALHDRPYLDGRYGDRLRHVSYFLSLVTRPHFHAGGVDLVPCHFSEVPMLLRRLPNLVVVAACSPPDRHGYVSLGTNADYVAPFIGRVPFFVEANPRMPRTFGRNGIHLSQVAGWCEVDRPLVEVDPPAPDDVDRRIAALVAERIPDGACIQAGIGSIPERRARVALTATGTSASTPSSCPTASSTSSSRASPPACGKVRRPGKVVTTFALGTQPALRLPRRQPRRRAAARSTG